MKKKIVAMFLVMSLSLLGNTAVWASNLDGSLTVEPTENAEGSDEDEKVVIVEPLDPDSLDKDKGNDIVEPSDPVQPKDPSENLGTGSIKVDDIANLVVKRGIMIDEINFPDAAFREMVKGCDEDGDGILIRSEIEGVESITYSSESDLTWDHSIQDAAGIEYFTNLEELDCSGIPGIIILPGSGIYSTYNQLSNLDISKNTNLKKLNCASNQLSSLDVTQKSYNTH